jgi:GAF domain-containing protein
VGILSLVSREDRQFEPETLQLLEAIAYQVGLAVGRASLFVEERARRAHLAALLEINTKNGALAPTDALLSSIADEAARLLGVRRSASPRSVRWTGAPSRGGTASA